MCDEHKVLKDGMKKIGIAIRKWYEVIKIMKKSKKWIKIVVMQDSV